MAGLRRSFTFESRPPSTRRVRRGAQTRAARARRARAAPRRRVRPAKLSYPLHWNTAPPVVIAARDSMQCAIDIEKITAQDFQECVAAYLIKHHQPELITILEDGNISNARHHSVSTSCMDLLQEEINLGTLFLHHPDRVQQQLDLAVRMAQDQIYNRERERGNPDSAYWAIKESCHLRVHSLPKCPELCKPTVTSIRATDINRLLSVSVWRASPVRCVAGWLSALCPRCSRAAAAAACPALARRRARARLGGSLRASARACRTGHGHSHRQHEDDPPAARMCALTRIHRIAHPPRALPIPRRPAHGAPAAAAWARHLTTGRRPCVRSAHAARAAWRVRRGCLQTRAPSASTASPSSATLSSATRCCCRLSAPRRGSR